MSACVFLLWKCFTNVSAVATAKPVKIAGAQLLLQSPNTTGISKTKQEEQWTTEQQFAESLFKKLPMR